MKTPRRGKKLGESKTPIPVSPVAPEGVDRHELLERFVDEVDDQAQVRDRDHFAIPRDVAVYLRNVIVAFSAQEKERKGGKRPSWDKAFALRKRGGQSGPRSNTVIEEVIGHKRKKAGGATWPEIMKEQGSNALDAEAPRKRVSRYGAQADAVKISREISQDLNAEREKLKKWRRRQLLVLRRQLRGVTDAKDRKRIHDEWAAVRSPGVDGEPTARARKHIQKETERLHRRVLKSQEKEMKRERKQLQKEMKRYPRPL